MGISPLDKPKTGRISGFALIEFLVVIGVVGLMLPAIFTMYLIAVQNQQKAKIITAVKQNGDNALSIMENLIHGRAVSIYDTDDTSTKICVSGSVTPVELGNSITFGDEQDNLFTFLQDSTDLNARKIASTSASTTLDLTSDKVSVTSLSFSCVRLSQFSSPIVKIEFTVTQAGDPQRHEEENTLDYETNIKLRN